MAEVLTKDWLKVDQFREVIFYISCVGSFGILPLICFYYPHIFLQLRTVSCHPNEATLVAVTFENENFICEVDHFDNDMNGEKLIMTEVENVRFCASSRNKFTFCRVPEVPIHFKRFLLDNYVITRSSAELDKEQELIRIHYGGNVMKIPEATFLEVSMRYFLSPFYIFQYFSATIWFIEDYWTYATVILIITFGAIYVTAQESLANLESLRTLAGVHSTVQRIKRKASSPEAGSCYSH